MKTILCTILILMAVDLTAKPVSENKDFENLVVRYEPYKVSSENAEAMEMAVNPILIIIKEAIKKVIRAVDLVMQRFQKQYLRLQLAMEKLRNEMSKLKLDEIHGWVEEKKEIFDKYYNELWALNAKMEEIKGIKEAIESQAALLTSFNKAYELFQGDSYLKADEISMIYDIYMGMLEKNLDHIDDLRILITADKVQMEDGERLEMIEETMKKMKRVGVDFQVFTGKIKRISLSRAYKVNEAESIKTYYGLE